MKKKKSASVKAIVDRHLNDITDIILEEDMRNMTIGVEAETEPPVVYAATKGEDTAMTND